MHVRKKLKRLEKDLPTTNNNSTMTIFILSHSKTSFLFAFCNSTKHHSLHFSPISCFVFHLFNNGSFFVIFSSFSFGLVAAYEQKKRSSFFVMYLKTVSHFEITSNVKERRMQFWFKRKMKCFRKKAKSNFFLACNYILMVCGMSIRRVICVWVNGIGREAERRTTN